MTLCQSQVKLESLPPLIIPGGGGRMPGGAPGGTPRPIIPGGIPIIPGGGPPIMPGGAIPIWGMPGRAPIGGAGACQ